MGNWFNPSIAHITACPINVETEPLGMKINIRDATSMHLTTSRNDLARDRNGAVRPQPISQKISSNPAPCRTLEDMTAAVPVVDKYGEILAEILGHAGAQATVRSSEGVRRSDGVVVHVVVEVPDLSDWALRYAVLEAAGQIESEYGATVIPLFREAAA